MNPSLLERFEALLREWAGQWFPESRRGELARALGRAAERTGWGSDTVGFVEALEKRSDEALRDLVVNEVLVNETYFFRDAQLWKGIEKEILPDLLRRHGNTRNLRIWSCGCSTGEEPYSVALLLRACLPMPDEWTIHLLATDLSARALERARATAYGKRAFRELDRTRWGSNFEPAGPAVRLAEPVRKMVHFRSHNLASLDFPSPLTNRMDLILCRNVLIYLERKLVNQVVERFAQCLSTGGWLVLAPTEVPLEPPEGMSLTRLAGGSIVLRKGALEDTAARPALPRNRYATSPSTRGSSTSPPGPAPHVPSPRTARTAPPAPRYSTSPSSLAVPEEPPHQAPPQAARTTGPLAEARAAANRGDLSRALARAMECVNQSPLDPAGWLVLALVQEEMALLDDAVQSLRRALYLDSNQPLGHLQMARVQVAQGDGGALRSLANFRKLVEGTPPETELPEGDGVTVGETLYLANRLERACGRLGART